MVESDHEADVLPYQTLEKHVHRLVVTALVATTLATAPAQAQSPPPGAGRPGAPNANPPRPGPDRPPGGTAWNRPPGTRPPPPPRPRNWSRNWNQWHRWDYNRPPPGHTWYYADQYYRDGRYYQPRRLGRGDRIYRGYNGRYYCRRSDGTTGLIVGSIAGSLLGGLLANGDSDTVGALAGLSAGAALGAAIDRGQVICH
jgi:hypothetical protein